MGGTVEKRAALILAGAVAKGAYEAGALEVVAEAGERITTVVGASAGALNACLYAAGIALGRERDAAERLVRLWRRKAGASSFICWTPGNLLLRGGLSGTRRVEALVRKELDDMFAGARADMLGSVNLRLVVTRLDGRTITMADGTKATSFEDVVAFTEADLADAAKRKEIAAAAAASACFPGLFVPRAVDALGRCLDGGIVNNTPIKEALAGPGVERILVVVPQPAVLERAKVPRTLLGLAFHVGDIAIQERLFRDLKVARDVNRSLAKLETIGLEPTKLDAVYDAFFPGRTGESRPRPIEIVEVRPLERLEGTVFCGFFCPKLRKDYTEAGQKRAREVLG